MKLVAALIVRNELHRYLRTCVSALLEFCDEVRILDDGSTDGWTEACMGAWGKDGLRVRTFVVGGPSREDEPSFHQHAAARNRLLEWAARDDATHVLSIDADEFVADGKAVREACETSPVGAWSLCMQEVWNADENGLEIRQDGGWSEHEVTMLWATEGIESTALEDRGHATGRVPDAVHLAPRGHTCTTALHFGWTNQLERAERFARYDEGDAGQYHARQHIDSIMFPDDRIQLVRAPWPTWWPQNQKQPILDHATLEVSDG